MLASDSAVGRRRRQIAAYLYAYTRILEIACSWTMTVPDVRFKVALGRKIGLDGLAIERLSRRITQMATTTARGAAPASYARWLDSHHAEDNAGRMAAVLLATIDDLDRSITTYIAKTHHGDEPTRLMLQTLLSDLKLGRDTLAPYAQGTIDPPSIDSDEPTVAYTGEDSLVPIPDFPARPANYIRNLGPPPSPIPMEKMMAADEVAKFFRRMYLEIEICAIEVCARNIVERREMPHAFKVDMSQQIWDEARHAELTQTVFEQAGFGLDEALTYTGMVWTRHAMGVDLAERLAIEQVIQEGHSVDKAYLSLDMFRSHGHHHAADALEWLAADETQHALIGNRWLMRLCDGKREKYEAVVAAAEEKIKFPLPPVNRTLREIAGFPEWHIDALEREFAARKSRAGQ